MKFRKPEMTEEKIDGNVVNSDEFKYGKATQRNMPSDLRKAAVVSMKGMIGSHKAVTVRVAAI